MKKKKGGAVLEMLIITPIAILFIWLILQFTFYIDAKSQINQAAQEASGVVATYMRDKGLSSTANVPNNDPVLDQKIKDAIQRVVGVSRLQEMNSHLSGLSIQYQTNNTPCNPTAAYEICVTSTDEQVEVSITSQFSVVQNAHLFGSAADLSMNALGVTQRELANRYQYY